MKVVLEYPKGSIMLVLLIAFFVSCGVGSKVPVKAIPTQTVIINTLPIIPIQQDTVIKQPKPIHIEDKPVIKVVEHNAEYTPNLDTLFKRNLELQRITIRILDRSHEIRLQKDSALEMLKAIKDTVNATKSLTKSAKKDKEVIASTNSVFDTTIKICILISALGVLISWFKPFFKRKVYTV